MAWVRGWVCVAVVMVLGVPAARAQQVGGVDFGELFLMLDANADGTIERSEVPEKGREAFDRLAKLADTDKDGKIERNEYRGLLERARDSAQSPGGPGEGMARFRALDKNGDGKISRDEFPAGAALFDRADADKDGFLTPQEAVALRAAGGGAAGLPNGGMMPPRLRAMDKDGDGSISKEEYTGPPALFDRLDRNSDGKIGPAELRGFLNNAGGALKKKAQAAGKGETSKD